MVFQFDKIATENGTILMGSCKLNQSEFLEEAVCHVVLTVPMEGTDSCLALSWGSRDVRADDSSWAQRMKKYEMLTEYEILLSEH